MLFDVRTYTCRPGTIRKQMAMYEAEGLAVQGQNGPIFLPPRQPSPWARSLIDEALRQAAQSSPDRAVA